MRLSSSNQVAVTNLLGIFHHHVNLVQALVADSNVKNVDNVGMLKRPQNRDLAKCRDWYAILTVLRGQTDLLECNKVG